MNFPLPVYGERVASGASRVGGAKPKQVARARRLRRQPTNAELKLWFALRDRRLSGVKFVRQAPIGPYVADFLCRESNLVIEVDGGQHSENPIDRLRDAYMAERGYRTLRFWNTDVLGNLDGVLVSILSELEK